MSARDRLIDELRDHAVIVGEVVLTSGATAQYYVDAKRAILRPAGFAALGELIAGYARQWEATAAGVVGDELRERGEPRRAQDRPLGVDVVLRRPAARERDLADDQCVLAQLRDQRVSGVRVRHADADSRQQWGR